MSVSNSTTTEEMTIALRALAELTPLPDEAAPKDNQKRKDFRAPRPSRWTLTFDTETKDDPTQRFRFGSYQWRSNDELFEQGLFYDPDAVPEAETLELQRYALEKSLKLRTLTDFVDDVFYTVAYHWRGTVIGFNLPFDISRLAIGHATARRFKRTTQRGVIRDNLMSGGFSFCLSENKWLPRVQIKHINRRMAFIRFAKASSNELTGAAQKAKRKGHEVQEAPVRRGFFIDVKTIAAALLSRTGDLGALADHLGIAEGKLKQENFGRPIDRSMIEYNLRDTQVTWACFEKLRERYASFGLTRTPLHKVYSEASIAKALAREIGIKSQAEIGAELPKASQGQIISTFYGGRVEAGLRRTIAEIQYCDFRSMYPTVCVNTGLWRYFIASGIRWREDTEGVRNFLDEILIDDFQNPATWRRLVAIVQVHPDDDVYPVRGVYSESAVRVPHQTAQRTIGRNRLTSKKYALWFTLADCAVSKLMTGRTPRIVKAIVFEPREPQSNLRSIDLFGEQGYRIDPLKRDLFLELIDLRGDIADLCDKARTEEERSSLDARQAALKIIANSLTYGVNAELNEEELGENRDGLCNSYTGEPYKIGLEKFEKPGALFNPLLASVITAGARLMLTLAELQGQKRGLTWAFCDTDSIAYERPASVTREEFHQCVKDARAWFDPLNPYANKCELLKLEKANFTLVEGKAGTTPEPLYAYVVSSKRYALFNKGPDGRPILRKASAHGLGHVLDPYPEHGAPACIPKPAMKLHDIGCRRWQYDLWYRIVQAALHGNSAPDYSKLPNFDQPAPTQDTLTTPDKLRQFNLYNLDKQYSEHVTPFNFSLRFQPRPILHLLAELAGRGGIESKGKPKQAVRQSHPIAPYRKDPVEAAEVCIDRDTGQAIDQSELRTYAQVFARFHRHAESKFLNGGATDSGRTRMRHVVVGKIQNIGKEANQAEDQAIFGVDPEAQAIYGDPTEYELALCEVRAALTELPHSAIASAAGISIRQVGSVARGTSRPKQCTLDNLSKAVATVREIEASHASARAEGRAELAKLVASEGYRSVADQLGVDPSNLRKIVKGYRNPIASQS